MLALVLLEVAINPTTEPVDSRTGSPWEKANKQTNKQKKKPNSEGAQAHPSADNWIKDLQRVALPTRERSIFPTASPSPTRKLAQASYPHHQREKEEARIIILEPPGWKPPSQKANQNKHMDQSFV